MMDGARRLSGARQSTGQSAKSGQGRNIRIQSGSSQIGGRNRRLSGLGDSAGSVELDLEDYSIDPLSTLNTSSSACEVSPTDPTVHHRHRRNTNVIHPESSDMEDRFYNRDDRYENTNGDDTTRRTSLSLTTMLGTRRHSSPARPWWFWPKGERGTYTEISTNTPDSERESHELNDLDTRSLDRQWRSKLGPRFPSTAMLKRLVLRYPFILLAALVFFLTLFRPLAFWATHHSWGFVVAPIPPIHHLWGTMFQYPTTRNWLIAWDTTKPLPGTSEDGMPFPPPRMEQPWLPLLRSPNRPFHDTFKFPIEQLVDAPSMYEWPLPVLTTPRRRPRRRLRAVADGDKDSNKKGLSIKRPHAALQSSEGDHSSILAKHHPIDELVLADVVDAPTRKQNGHKHKSHPHSNHAKSCNIDDYFHDPYDLTSPALIAIHTFSTTRPKDRPTRDLLRIQQRRHIPLEYMHLVDFQFVIASPLPTPDNSDTWAALLEEQETWGDLLVLDEMTTNTTEIMIDNIDEGKTYRWMQEVVKRAEDGRGREAVWVMKSDDDSYHILKNLLDFILDLDPFEPTYFGSSFGTDFRNHQYFQGLGYGMNWRLLRTLVAANLPHNLTISHEDHRTGSWMFSLPPRPGATTPRYRPDSVRAFSPPNPDPHTGLVRADTFARQGSWYHWWLPQNAHTITAHGMKSEKEYLRAVRWFDWFWEPSWWRLWGSRHDARRSEWYPDGALARLKDRQWEGCARAATMRGRWGARKTEATG